MDFTIRKIKKEDLSQLLDIYKDLNPEDPAISVDDELEAHWESILNNKYIHYFVTTNKELLTSTCFLNIIPNLTRGKRPFGVLQNVAVHKDFQNQGIGKVLMNYVLDFAWEQNCYQVLVSCRPDSSGFYEKVGFRSDVKVGLVAKPTWEKA